MMELKITMTPMGPYFLGTERNASYIGEQNSQQSELRPYFIRSAKLPSQSALFGILRYLGIAAPKTNFSLDEADIENIGAGSYDLLSEEVQKFGRIHRISQLMLTDNEGRRYIPALRNRQAATLNGNCGDFVPFDNFCAVASIDGPRYLPSQYNEKEAWDGAEFLCLNDKKLYGSLFQTQVRVGINRQNQRVKEAQQEVSGFFKKEYVILKAGYSFLFYADVNDAFQFKSDSIAYVGQGRTPFAVHMEEIEDTERQITIPSACIPSSVNVNGTEKEVCYAVALSDCYYPGEIAELRNSCSLMIADSRDYRVFTTNYQAQSNHKRYRKNERGLKLLQGGSVFLFFGKKGQTPEEQMTAFKALVRQPHAQIAGFNQFYFSDGMSD